AVLRIARMQVDHRGAGLCGADRSVGDLLGGDRQMRRHRRRVDRAGDRAGDDDFASHGHAPSVAKSATSLLAAWRMRPWSEEMTNADAPIFLNCAASLALAAIMQTALPALRAAAAIDWVTAMTSGESMPSAPSATVRSPRPMKTPSSPSTFTIA